MTPIVLNCRSLLVMPGILPRSGGQVAVGYVTLGSR
jgi:hypothetical protein